MGNSCKKCTSHQCKTPTHNAMLECSYGLNYIKHNTIVLFGFCIKDINNSKQKKKRLYDSPECTVTNSFIDNYIKHSDELLKNTESEIAQLKSSTLDNYVSNNMYKDNFFNPIKNELQKNLSFLHDYQQINSTIIKNINVSILEKTGAEEINDDILKNCSHEEVAIYYASKMLDEKITLAKAIQDTSWLYREDDYKSFRIYGCFLKYIRIYKLKSDAKSIKINVSGSNQFDITRNPKAFSIIPHTLIDNAIKYSPKKSTISVYINDGDGHIYISVTSFGPKILECESDKIFQPFFRGMSAKEIEEDGSGFGLFLAQKIATEHLNSRIKVQQNIKQTLNGHIETTFSLKVPLRYNE